MKALVTCVVMALGHGAGMGQDGAEARSGSGDASPVSTGGATGGMAKDAGSQSGKGARGKDGKGGQARKGGKGGDSVANASEGGPGASGFKTEVPPIGFNVILSRPEADNVTLSLFSDKARSVVIQCDGKRVSAEVPAGRAVPVKLGELKANSGYSYEITGNDGEKLGAGKFRTQRAPGGKFVFCVQADAHLDDASVPELYAKTLGKIRADQPDFLIDLGDTFMAGKHPDREGAAKQYYAQRHYFGLTGAQVPLFLVLGNHDGEERPGELRDWAMARRKQYFSNPVADGFYTGNSGPQENYYAWTWGDAQFVVLDPYHSSTSNRGGREPWNFTLGDAQYHWLEKTLAGSKAKYKFVFIHQLTGSMTGASRGGKEAAKLHEWGDAGEEFRNKRPDWSMPVHQLLVKNGVNAVFHGHDHFYAREEMDGVVYQLVPQPAQRNFRKHFADEYGYRDGLFLPSSGYLRVTVEPAGVLMEYVRSAMPNMEKNGVSDGMVADQTRLPWVKTAQ